MNLMYSRFEALDNYSLKEIQGSTVAVVGLGATGSVMAEHLARHGVKLILIDRDFLERNDLYSSNIYTGNQVEKALPKAKACEKTLSELTEVEAYIEDLNSKNVELLGSTDLIMDGTDNLETRYLLDDYSKANDVPWIYTAALGERGFSMYLNETCFKCTFDSLNPKKSCETNGVLREISVIAASKSCLKALKYLSGEEVDEKLEILPENQKFEVQDCECGEQRDFEASNVCGENKYQVFGDSGPEKFGGQILASNSYLKKLEFEGHLITVFQSGRAIVEAQSLEDAKRLYRTASSI